MSRIALFILLLGAAACGATPTPAAEEAAPAAKEVATATYACPMHPDITADAAGQCSKCGMDLVEQKAHDHGSHSHDH
jgi:hypothetical protein